MNRRDLLTGSLQALGATRLAAQAPAAEAMGCEPCAPVPFPATLSPHARLAVKPVMTNMIHSGVWEGPCRFNVVTVDRETQIVNQSYGNWVKAINEGHYEFGPGAEVFEPSLVTFNEDFTIPAAAFAELERGAKAADVFFIAPHGSSNAAFDIVQRFHKPAILFGINCRTVDVAAYARSRGEEMLVVNDGAELHRTVDFLRARKIFRETRVLFPTNRGFPSVASLTGITDLNDLKERLGVSVTMIPYKALAEAMERALTAGAVRQKAEQAAGDLIRNAEHSYVDKEYVVRSIQFHETVKSLMEEHGCNAFTIECFEFCSSRLPEKWKITPCLIHTLFKDNGIASSCEGDMGALLAMRLLMSVSGRSSHLGNMFLRDGNLVEINHSAPGIRMNGFERPGLPYKLGRFVQSGWGTKVVVDFMNSPEKQVTVARMHPNARQVLVMKGTLVKSEGYGADNLGCSVAAFVKPALSGDGEAFVRRQTEYGNHLIWVYGDYSGQMKKLGEYMGLEVEVVS